MATFTPNIPPSQFLKAKGTKDDDGPRRQTKEEYRKMKELEEGRKAGMQNLIIQYLNSVSLVFKFNDVA